MNGLKVLIGGLFGAAVVAASAQAADMPDTWSPPERAPRYVELLSGWYLRGDLGYRWNKIGSVETTVPTTSHRIGDSMGATLGAGVRYKWFRSDITIDGTTKMDFRADTAPVGTSQPQYSAKIDAVSGLLNFYVDFGTWIGFTPYVGAGAGATYLHATRYMDTALATLGPSSESARTNFSWAWMAGVAFQVHPHWLVDVGFRHLELGSVAMTANTLVPTPPTTLRKISTDEVRVGLRFLFD